MNLVKVVDRTNIKKVAVVVEEISSPTLGTGITGNLPQGRTSSIHQRTLVCKKEKKKANSFQREPEPNMLLYGITSYLSPQRAAFPAAATKTYRSCCCCCSPSEPASISSWKQNLSSTWCRVYKPVKSKHKVGVLCTMALCSSVRFPALSFGVGYCSPEGEA